MGRFWVIMTIPLQLSMICHYAYSTPWQVTRTNHRPRYVSFWCPREGSHLLVPSSSYLGVYMGCVCFGYCFSGPLPLRSLTNGPLFHIHLSIEAQCVTTLLPLGDCHMYDRVGLQEVRAKVNQFNLQPISPYESEGETHPGIERLLKLTWNGQM